MSDRNDLSSSQQPPHYSLADLPRLEGSGHLNHPRALAALRLHCGPTALWLVKTTVGGFDNNCYFLAGDDGQAVLVDAADDAEFLLDLCQGLGWTLTDVVTTHSHADHTRALVQILNATGARHHASAGDAPDLPAAVDRTVGHHEVVDFRAAGVAAAGITGFLLSGHTTSGLNLVIPAEPVHLLVGDCLFPGGVGKTYSSQDFSTLYHSVVEEIFDRFGDDTLVHPGHGDDTTVGAERPHLGQWLARGW